MLHWTLGMLTLVGGILLFILAVLNERSSKPRIEAATQASAKAYMAQETIAGQSEVVRALGMRQAMITRQLKERDAAVTAQSEAQFIGGRYTGAIKFLRLVLQSLTLGAGAWLAVEGQISAGAIIAASVLLSRAVQPIEQVVGAWNGIVQARAAWANLTELFASTADQDRPRTLLPKPAGLLTLDGVGVRAPAREQPLLRHVSFTLQPGESLGIIGPSGSGKSTLLRLLLGVWSPHSGIVRIDGADIATWPRSRLGRHIGYLPQDVELFSGSVAENIARMGEPEAQQVIAAAQRANAHEMILRLPQGYDTQIGDGGAALSGGQRQRIGLARALYGKPRLVVLDEPNASLDAEGEAALARSMNALRSQGVTLIVVSHRRRMLAGVDKLLVLREGSLELFGPRSEVLSRLTRGAVPPPNLVPQAAAPGKA